MEVLFLADYLFQLYLPSQFLFYIVEIVNIFKFELIMKGS